VSIDDRIRAATEAVAGTVREIPPLELPPDVLAGRPRRRFRGPAALPHGGAWWAGLLIPLTAAVAVIAVAAMLVVIRNLPGPPAKSGPASLAGAPRYYVQLGVEPVGKNPELVVGDAVTGAVAATVPEPAGINFVGVTGAGDDRTFVINARAVHGRSSPQAGDPWQLWYVLRIAPGTAHPATLTRLPIADTYTNAAVSGTALSPDGRTLAVMVVPNAANPHLDPGSTQSLAHALPVGPVTLHTYAVPSGRLLRTWTYPWSGKGTPPGEDNWAEMSWLADGHTLAFEYPLSPSTVTSKTAGTLVELDTARAGTELISGARVVLHIPHDFACEPGAGLLSPDGRTWFCGGSPGGDCKTNGVIFSAYSVATGKREDVLYHYPTCDGLNPEVAWAGRGESMIGVFLITNPTVGMRVGFMEAGRFAALKLASVADSNTMILPGRIAF
jgi:hypothetical protein